MTALEEIKSQLDVDMNKGITTVDRLRIIAGGVPDFDPITVEDAEWIISALESLQRENEEKSAWIKAATTEITKAIGGGSEMFTPHGDEFRVDPAFVTSFIQYRRERHAESKKASIQKERDLLARAEAAEAEVKRLTESRDGYVKQRDQLQKLYDDERASCIREAKLATDMANDCNDSQARVKVLEEALAPFHHVGPIYEEHDDADPVWSGYNNGNQLRLTVGDFRRARTTLASTGGEHHAE